MQMERVLHSPGLLILLFAISGLLGGLVYWLFRLYQGRSVLEVGWAADLEVDPEDFGGFRYSWLALVSLLSLFLEMLMIRWISSEIRIFAYFKNLVLVACFLGFGLGCYLCRRKINVLATVVPLVALSLLIKF